MSYLDENGVNKLWSKAKAKFAPINYRPESVIDYGDTNKTIKIGYSGAGLSASQILYIAGYTAGANDNEHKIKDISKDVLKSWLGYTEVATGTLSANTALDVPSGYACLVLATGTNNSFKFGSSTSAINYTTYQFMFIQYGNPKTTRYFSSATTLAMTTWGSTTKFYFNSTVQYIKFKIG